VFHSTAGDLPAPGWAALEIGAPATVGDAKLDPVATDASAGWWVVSVH